MAARKRIALLHRTTDENEKRGRSCKRPRSQILGEDRHKWLAGYRIAATMLQCTKCGFRGDAVINRSFTGGGYRPTVDTGFVKSLTVDAALGDVPGGTAGSERDAGRVLRIATLARIGIDSVTGLATDFLNQFNEVSMLLDMVAEDPSLLDDLEAWQARDYVAHFAASGFADRHLVLEAYQLAPPLTRRRFDALCSELVEVLVQGLAFLSNCRAAGARAAVAPAAQALGIEVRAHLDRLDALIHAGRRRPAQSHVDSMFGRRRT